MAWDVVSKELNSLLTSTEINQLQLNFNAFANQDSGAPTYSPNTLTITGVTSTGTLNVSSDAFIGTDLIIGHSASISGLTNPDLEIISGNVSDFGGGFYEFSATTGRAPIFELGHSYSNTIGTHTALADTSVLGTLRFMGSDGTSFLSGSTILCAAEGTPTTNQMPSYLSFSTNGGAATTTERFRITNGGILSSGNESSPDADPGGLTLNHGSNDGSALTVKNNDVSHGMTSIMEDDTYFTMGKYDGDRGGAEIRTAVGSGGDNISLNLNAVVSASDTTDTTGSKGAIRMRLSTKSGTSSTSIGATGNLLSVDNFATTRFLIKGNGDIHATNTVITALDEEDDLTLVENLKNYTGGKNYKHRVSKKQKEKLEEIGVIKGDFLNLQTMHALELGAITQMWKAMCKVAKKIGFSEEEMHKLAMEG